MRGGVQYYERFGKPSLLAVTTPWLAYAAGCAVACNSLRSPPPPPPPPPPQPQPTAAARSSSRRKKTQRACRLPFCERWSSTASVGALKHVRSSSECLLTSCSHPFPACAMPPSNMSAHRVSVCLHRVHTRFLLVPCRPQTCPLIE
jgi:hypothetical protein